MPELRKRPWVRGRRVWCRSTPPQTCRGSCRIGECHMLLVLRGLLDNMLQPRCVALGLV